MYRHGYKLATVTRGSISQSVEYSDDPGSFYINSEDSPVWVGFRKDTSSVLVGLSFRSRRAAVQIHSAPYVNDVISPPKPSTGLPFDRANITLDSGHKICATLKKEARKLDLFTHRPPYIVSLSITKEALDPDSMVI